jgi:hypothetical protein
VCVCVCVFKECNMHVHYSYACMKFERDFTYHNARNWSFTLDNIIAARLFPYEDHPSSSVLKKVMWLGP